MCMYSKSLYTDHEVSQILFDQGVNDISISFDTLIAGFAMRLTILYSIHTCTYMYARFWVRIGSIYHAVRTGETSLQWPPNR
jgi:hypothetical protein